MKRENICIIGAGAVGLLLTCKFHPRHNVFVLAREYHIPELRAATIELCGAESFSLSPESAQFVASKNLGDLPKDTSFWLCVKAYDLDETAAEIRPYLSQTTPVAVLSNGLGIFFQVATLIGKTAPIVRVCPQFGVRRTTPVRVEAAGALRAMLAGPPQHSRSVAQIREILNIAGIAVQDEKDVATAEWKKALINLTVNPICSILNTGNCSLADDARLRQLTAAVLQEVSHVAKADGFDLDGDLTRNFFEGLKISGANINSTLCDLRAGGKSEMDYILGRFLRIADDYDIQVPVSRTLYALFKFLEEGGLGPAPAWPARTPRGPLKVGSYEIKNT